MSTQETKTESDSRHTTIILICSKKAHVSTSVRFFSGLSHDIYLICNFCLFSQYVEELIDRTQSAPNYTYESLSIILVNEDISVLLQALQLLRSKQISEFSAHTKKKFFSMYKQSLTSAYSTKDLEFEVTLPVGLVDCPLGFETCILQTCEGYSHIDHLSESHVWTQQIIRFLALKHGASFGAISGLYEHLETSSIVFDFVERIRSESSAQMSGWVVFKMEGAPIVDDLLMHQFIPLGEDTWNKLMLVAKSIPQVKKSEKIFTTELQFQELSDMYDAHLERVSTGQDASIGNSQLLQFMGIETVEEKKEPASLLNFKDLLESIRTTEIEVSNK